MELNESMTCMLSYWTREELPLPWDRNIHTEWKFLKKLPLTIDVWSLFDQIHSTIGIKDADPTSLISFAIKEIANRLKKEKFYYRQDGGYGYTYHYDDRTGIFTGWSRSDHHLTYCYMIRTTFTQAVFASGYKMQSGHVKFLSTMKEEDSYNYVYDYCGKRDDFDR